MADQVSDRIRGQEVSIIIAQDTNVQDTLNDILNFNSELTFELKNQGYLGQKAEIVDMIFKSAKFDYEMHTYTQDWTTLYNAILNKAKRNIVDTNFNIQGVLSYYNGDQPSFLFNNCAFGPLPMNISNRESYVGLKMNGGTGDVDITPSQ